MWLLKKKRKIFTLIFINFCISSPILGQFWHFKNLHNSQLQTEDEAIQNPMQWSKIYVELEVSHLHACIPYIVMTISPILNLELYDQVLFNETSLVEPKIKYVVYCGNFHPHIQFWLLNSTKNRLIKWAMVNDKDCHCKFQNWSWETNILRSQKVNILFLTIRYIGPSNYVHY